MAAEVRGHGSQRGQTAEGAGGAEQPTQAVGSGSGDADSDPAGGERKKMVSPSAKRRAVQYACEQDLGSVAKGCAALRLGRSTFYRVGRVSRSRQRIEQRIEA